MINTDIQLEKKLWDEGFKYIVGLDEAGRGPWAGPVVAGAVLVLQDHIPDIAVTDSKKMTEARRLIAYEKIINSSYHKWGVGVVEPSVIDTLGINAAIRIAMESAVKGIETEINKLVEYLLIDGQNVQSIPLYKQYKVNNGDGLHYSIAAASIIAKVTRDRIMEEYTQKYPEFRFDKHKGYGTKQHQEELKQHGVTAIHRKTYAPISDILKHQDSQ